MREVPDSPGGQSKRPSPEEEIARASREAPPAVEVQTSAEAAPGMKSQPVELEIPNHPTETLADARERWNSITRNTKNAFSKLKDGIATGKNFVLGSPAMVVGKANEILNGARNGIAEGRRRFSQTCEHGKQATTERLRTWGNKAAQFGLSKVAPIEDGILRAWNELPALIEEREGRKSGDIAAESKKTLDVAKSEYSAQMDALEDQIAQLLEQREGLKKRMEGETVGHELVIEHYSREMWQRLLDAQDRRKKVGPARAALESLQRRAA